MALLRGNARLFKHARCSDEELPRLQCYSDTPGFSSQHAFFEDRRASSGSVTFLGSRRSRTSGPATFKQNLYRGEAVGAGPSPFLFSSTLCGDSIEPRRPIKKDLLGSQGGLSSQPDEIGLLSDLKRPLYAPMVSRTGSFSSASRTPYPSVEDVGDHAQ